MSLIYDIFSAKQKPFKVFQVNALGETEAKIQARIKEAFCPPSGEWLCEEPQHKSRIEAEMVQEEIAKTILKACQPHEKKQ